jgi:hypothetical protein
MKKIKEEVADHPILSLFLVVFSSTILTLGTTTFATMSYVDNKHKEGKQYVREKHDELKQDLTEMKDTLQDINNNILDLYKNKGQ